MAATDLVLPNTLKKVDDFAFAACSNNLRHVTFLGQTDTIGEAVFRHANINCLRFKATVPPAITGNGPLYDMGRLDSIIVPCGSLNAWLTDSYWGLFADKYHEDCNSIEDAAEVRVSVYPNPATDRLTVGGVEGDVHIEIVNTFGQTVLSCAISGSTNEIDVSGLVRGPYFLRIQSSDRIVTTKIILL